MIGQPAVCRTIAKEAELLRLFFIFPRGLAHRGLVVVRGE